MSSKRHLVLDFDALAEDALNEVGKILKKDAKENMDKTSYGHRKYSYKVGRVRWVSRRGDPPNNETGDLNKTIDYKVIGRFMEFGAGSSRVNYAKYLEGNLNRPNITKSVDSGKKKIEEELERKFIDHVRWNGD